MTDEAKQQTSPVDDALISVIIPVYNCERYVAAAIESVLAQEHKNIEIILVDDESTDGTAKVLHSFPAVKYLHQSRKGASAARNNGVRCCHGDFIAFLDADDVWVKDKLGIQKQCFAADPGLDMVFGHVEQFFSPELEDSLKDKIKLTAARMPGYLPGTLLIKKTSFLKAGFYNEELRLGEVVDWYLRALDAGLKSIVVPDTVMRRRIHDDNSGIRERENRRDYLRLLKASLDRRRKNEQ